ncbi:MAG TPA: SEL1-like repeat protein [Candidatus Hydrogenedens sp.]|nr:SEL1-like repeat protein [Candidatus Hydrogenedens sp.]HOK10625.1 SEL1-like repeat protein [Candidatus Hydrogenedens sp.]HOL19315.1 SEL1-like repeat protein [Candidatus Hydrogenedens sp.]HPP59268.1 SEL1-like repeat protein [Candidatus Hydrogenedens sp.]
MYNLGVMYYNGRGVPQDYGKARECFGKAVKRGDADAVDNLKSLKGKKRK